LSSENWNAPQCQDGARDQLRMRRQPRPGVDELVEPDVPNERQDPEPRPHHRVSGHERDRDGERHRVHHRHHRRRLRVAGLRADRRGHPRVRMGWVAKPEGAPWGGDGSRSPWGSSPCCSAARTLPTRGPGRRSLGDRRGRPVPRMARLDRAPPSSSAPVRLGLRAADADPQDVPEAHDAQHRRALDDRQMPEALAHHGLGGIVGVHVGAGGHRVSGHPLRDRR
jgi:hypothetical protein